MDYDQYMTATTVDEFFARKGNWGHLKYDVQRGYCTLDAAQLDSCWRSVQGTVVLKVARARRKRASADNEEPTRCGKRPASAPEFLVTCGPSGNLVDIRVRDNGCTELLDVICDALPDMGEDHVEAIFRQSESQSFVATERGTGRVVGGLTFRLLYVHHTTIIEISALAVDPTFRKGGIGAQLVECVKRVASTQKARLCLHADLDAVKFWCKLGFRGTRMMEGLEGTEETEGLIDYSNSLFMILPALPLPITLPRPLKAAVCKTGKAAKDALAAFEAAKADALQREALDASSKKFDGAAWLMTVPSDDDVLAIIPHVLEADLLGEEDDFDSSVDGDGRARRIHAPKEEADVFELQRRARDWDPYDDENLVRVVVKMRGLDAERLAVEFHVKAQFLRDRWRTQFEHAYIAAELEAKEGLRCRVRKFIDELGEIERSRWREELKRWWDSSEKEKFEAHVVERTLLRAPAVLRNNCWAGARSLVDGGFTEPRGWNCKPAPLCAAVVDPFTGECCGRVARARGFCKVHGGPRRCTHRLECGLLCQTPARYGDLCAAHGGYPSCLRCGQQITSGATCTECGGNGKIVGRPRANTRTLGRRVVVDEGDKKWYKFLCEKKLDGGDFCPKRAEHASAFCKGHGGGERCEKVLDDGTTCGNGAVSGGVRNRCITHGGGPRCPHEDPVSGACGRPALYGGPTLSCRRHGGGPQCSSADVHLGVPERAHYKVEGKYYCYFCLCVKYPDDSRANVNVCKETLILAELERLAPDLYQNVRLGVVANVPRLTVRPQVLEYTCDKTLGACSRRRPDVFLDFGFHIIIGEVDENQHKSYTPRCEYKRLLDILEDAGDRPLHAVRLNPDEYTDSKGKAHESMFERVERRGHPGYEARQPEFDRRVGAYVAALRAARDAHSHSELYRVTTLFYDGHVEGETPGHELAPDML